MTLRNLSDIPDLVDEVLFHNQFSERRVATFCGRVDVLNLIKSQLNDMEKESSPIVIYGKSGCGKTSVISMVARHANKWLKTYHSAIVVRYLGTTPTSTKICPMLKSVCTQLCSIYGIKPKNEFEMPMDLFKHFFELIQTISQRIQDKNKNKDPLILLFDSLDQLSSVDNAHCLAWLPKRLPPYVKVVTSTLDECTIFQTLHRSKPSDALHINVGQTDRLHNRWVNFSISKKKWSHSD